MNYAVGVDIGGTKVAIAVVNQNGEIVSESTIPTDLSISPEEMIASICKEIKKVIRDGKIGDDAIIGIGIGAPGPLDSERGIILSPPNLSNWKNVPIQQLVEQSFSVPVRLENDADVAALGERWIGAANGCDNFVYITVGTGIGAGVFINGKLFRGVSGNAGEIGHTVVDPSFGKCTCGQYGCLGLIASGKAIEKRGKEIIGKDVSVKQVFALYEDGHSEIVDMVNHVFQVLGIACVSVINTFDPSKIVIGGGVSMVGDPLFQSLSTYVGTNALNLAGRRTEITPAHLGDKVGVVGAAGLFMDIIY